MPKNILFVFADQHRHNVMGCAGHPIVETPNLDALAAEGVRFEQAWCQSPICQPSRASVITGKYAHELGVIHNTGGFDPSWPTVMKQLQAAGYETATIGKTHYHESYQPPAEGGQIDMRDKAEFVKAFGWDHGLEEYDKYMHVERRISTPYTEHLAEHDQLDAYRTQIKEMFRLTPSHWQGATSVLSQELDLTSFLADEATRWLKSRAKEKPFFLKLAFVQPHVPLIDDPDWADYYKDADIDIPSLVPAEQVNETWGRYLDGLNRHSQTQVMDEAFVREGIRHYLGMVSLVDQKVGEVLQALADLGQLEDTWVIHSSDHGEMLGDHGLWAKMNFYRGSVQVPLIIKPPGGTQSRIERGLVELTDVSATLAEIAGTEPPEGSHGRSLLPALSGSFEGREALYSRIGNFGAIRQANHRLTTHLKTGTDCELFDLKADPEETENLINDAAQQNLIEDLHQSLMRHEQIWLLERASSTQIGGIV